MSDLILPNDRDIMTTSKGRIENEIGLDLLKLLGEHTVAQTKGTYGTLVLGRYENLESAEFYTYRKSHTIIALFLLAHSCQLNQLLKFVCFSDLKRLYSRKIEVLISAHNNRMTKFELLIFSLPDTQQLK